MTTSSWRTLRNELARARLEKALPAIFPAPVLQHALARPLIPPTPLRLQETLRESEPGEHDG